MYILVKIHKMEEHCRSALSNALVPKVRAETGGITADRICITHKLYLGRLLG